MRRSFLLTLLLLAGMANRATSQDPALRVRESTESQVDFHLTNYGIFGLDVYGNASGFFSPRGSGSSYLFGSGLWFGARKEVADSDGVRAPREMVFLTYNPNSGASWAYPYEFPLDPTPPLRTPELYHSVDFDHATGIYITPTVPPAGPRPWPMWLNSGETATPMYAGHFELDDRLRDATAGAHSKPAFMPGTDEQFVSRFTDTVLQRYEIGVDEAVKRGYPLRLLMEQNVYGWKGGRYQEVVVIDYQVINRSGDTLRDCVIGQASDPDLGQPDNDHVEFYAARPDLRAGRAWTDREIRGAWGQLVMVMVEAPVVDANGFVDNTRRGEFETAGRVGSFPDWTVASDPVTDGERYDFMTAGTFATDDSAGDKRAMMASTTFNLLPGDTAHFAIAYGVLHGTFPVAHQKGIILAKSSDLTDDEALERFSRAIISDYYSDRYHSETSSSAVSIEEYAALPVSIAPNPALNSATLGFAVATPSIVVVRVVDLLGRTVARHNLGIHDAGTYAATLDCNSFDSGTYTVVIEAGSAISSGRLVVTR